jgi:hypothetical protein
MAAQTKLWLQKDLIITNQPILVGRFRTADVITVSTGLHLMNANSLSA